MPLVIQLVVTLLVALAHAHNIHAHPPTLQVNFGGRVGGPATAAEGDLRTSAAEVALVLTGDAWSANVSAQGDVSAALLAGLRGVPTLDETAGWDEVVAPQLNHSMVRRVDDGLLLISLPRFPCFDILSPERVAVLVPAAATVSGGVPVPAPPLRIEADAGGQRPRWGSVHFPPVEEARNCTHLTLRWSAPEADGGTGVAHYRLEVRALNASGGNWSASAPVAGTVGAAGPLEAGVWCARPFAPLSARPLSRLPR
jgi:hypothetical protein